MSAAPTRKRLARLRDGAQLVMFPSPADVAFLLDALDEAVALLQPRNVPSITDAEPNREYQKRRIEFLKSHARGGEVLYPDLPERAKRPKKSTPAPVAPVATKSGKAPVPRKQVTL